MSRSFGPYEKISPTEQCHRSQHCSEPVQPQCRTSLHVSSKTGRIKFQPIKYFVEFLLVAPQKANNSSCSNFGPIAPVPAFWYWCLFRQKCKETIIMSMEMSSFRVQMRFGNLALLPVNVRFKHVINHNCLKSYNSLIYWVRFIVQLAHFGSFFIKISVTNYVKVLYLICCISFHIRIYENATGLSKRIIICN